MTTVSSTVNNIFSTSISVAPDVPFIQYADLGEFRSRSTTGGDRAPGSKPGMIVKWEPYHTRPKFRTVKYKLPDTFVLRVPPRKGRDGKLKKKKVVGKTVRQRVLEIPSQLKYRKTLVPDPHFDGAEEHAYSGTLFTMRSSAACYTKRNGSYDNWGTARQLNYLSYTDPWDPSLDQIALLGKLRTAVAGSDFNAGVAIAELPRALSMVASSATKIYSAFRAVKAGNFLGAKNILAGKQKTFKARKTRPTDKAASDAWLELQYGWKPLLKDIYEGMVFIDHNLRRPAVKTFRVRQYAGGKKSSIVHIPWPQNIARLPVKAVSSSSIVARLKEADVARLSGLLDPASVAWELLPYSFVIDWFIPIGNYLSARSLASALTGTFITTHRYRYESYGARAQSSYPLSTYNDGSKCYIKFTSIQRTVSTTLSVPPPTIRPLSKVATWGHAANAVALLTQLRR